MTETLNVERRFLPGWRQLREQNGCHARETHFGLAHDGTYFTGTSYDDVRKKMEQKRYSTSPEVIKPVAEIDAHVYHLMCSFWSDDGE